MIAERQEIEIERENIGREASFKMEANATIMKMLRDSIYTDKILAVLREYSCNALEAHMLNGNQARPIQITLPNYFDSMLRIRDFGPGLPFEKVHSLLCSYGSTTKDKSNDYIGCFGIGSKAGFAYTTTFQITSIYKGKKIVLNAYVDETEVGKISELSNGPADEGEESGIEIAIPIKNHDYDTFKETARKLFRFWDLPPIVKGDRNYVPFVNEYHYKKDGKWGFLKEPQSSYSYNRSNQSYLVMGGIAYKISAGSIGHITSLQSNMLSKSLIIFAKIGDVAIAANREEIAYKEKTITFLKAELKQIESDIRKMMDDDFAVAKTEYEVKKLYHQYFGRGTNNFIHELISGNYSVKFNNEEIKGIDFPIDNAAMDKITLFHTPSIRNTNPLRSHHEITVDLINLTPNNHPLGQIFYTIGVWDHQAMTRLMRYYKREHNDYNLHVYIIHFKTDQDRINWETKIGCPAGLIKELFSSIVIPPKVREPRKPREKNPKTNCVVYDPNSLIPEAEKLGDYEHDGNWSRHEADLDAVEGLYVIKYYSKMYPNVAIKDMDKKVHHSKDHYLQRIMEVLKAIDGNWLSDKVIYAINESDLPKIQGNTDLVSLFDYAVEQLQSHYDQFDGAKIPLSESSFDSNSNFIMELIKKGYIKTPALINHLALFDKDIKPLKTFSNVDFLGVEKKYYDTTKIEELKKLISDEWDKYPLFSLMSLRYSLNEIHFKDIELYMAARGQYLSNQSLISTLAELSENTENLRIDSLQESGLENTKVLDSVVSA